MLETNEKNFLLFENKFLEMKNNISKNKKTRIFTILQKFHYEDLKKIFDSLKIEIIEDFNFLINIENFWKNLDMKLGYKIKIIKEIIKNYSNELESETINVLKDSLKNQKFLKYNTIKKNKYLTIPSKEIKDDEQNNENSEKNIKKVIHEIKIEKKNIIKNNKNKILKDFGTDPIIIDKPIKKDSATEKNNLKSKKNFCFNCFKYIGYNTEFKDQNNYFYCTKNCLLKRIIDFSTKCNNQNCVNITCYKPKSVYINFNWYCDEKCYEEIINNN